MHLNHIKFSGHLICSLLWIAIIILVATPCVQAENPVNFTNSSAFSPVAPADRVITGDELKKASLTDWWEALRILEPSLYDEMKPVYGDAPGYLPSSVTVRGKSHWTMNADETSLPLFVIDGARVPLRQMMNMDINDIARVIVYKDPVSLSRFGINGGNGVIEIITQKPASGRLKVSYLFDGIFQNADLSSQKTDPKFAGSPVHTDWLKVPLHTGFQNRHKLNFEGGDDYVKYKFSARFSPASSGVMKGSKNDILGLNSYIEYNMKAIHISNDIVFNQLKNKASKYGTYDYFRGLNPGWAATDASGIPLTTLGDGLANPVYEATLNSFDETKTYEVYDNLNVRLQLKNGFSIDGLFGFARETTRHDIYISPSSGLYEDAEAGSNTGRYDVLRDNTLSFEGALDFKYNVWKGKSNFGASLGFHAFSGKYYDESYAGIGIPTDRMAYISFTKSYDTEHKAEANRTYDHTLQGIATARYSYDNRYSVSGNVNFNSSSRLSAGERNAWFYGIGANWNIHNESFLRNSGIKRFALNASIGTAGGVGFTDDDYNVTYTSNIGNEYVYNYYLIGSSIQSMPNRDIKWHTVHNRNIALFFDYTRFSFSFNYYNNLTSNALIFSRLPLSTGWENTISNGGKIENQGIEFHLSADILDNVKGWSLSAFVTGAHNSNKIKELPEYFGRLYNSQVAESNAKNSGTYRLVSELHEGGSVDGGTAPTFCGNIGASLRYKEWWLNAIFNCALGAKSYDWSAENTATEFRYQDNNEFGLGSLQLGYSFAPQILRKMRLREFTLALSSNNLFRTSSSDMPRGILYPYARTMAISLRISF